MIISYPLLKNILKFVVSSNNIYPLMKRDHFSRCDEKGLFFSVLIEELAVLGNKLFLETPTQEIITEVKALVNFLEKFAWRESGDNRTPQEFVGNYTRCAIRVVAARETLERGNTSGHETMISRLINAGFENIYLIGNNNFENRKFTQTII